MGELFGSVEMKASPHGEYVSLKVRSCGVAVDLSAHSLQRFSLVPDPEEFGEGVDISIIGESGDDLRVSDVGGYLPPPIV